MLAHVGNPQTMFATVHVGGTNGKGSVATMIADALRVAGWRVGLYTSPHLVHVRERIVVDGCAIRDDAFLAWANQLHPVIESTGASFFEATTAIALADFAARGVEIAVIEVGLGGRLDATNVIDPLVAIVTSVSLEHQDYLGDTVESIAREKAGIAKRGVPFIIGEQDPAVATLLGTEAAARGAVVTTVPPDVTYEAPLALVGSHQRRNAAVAAAGVEAIPKKWRPDGTALREGFARAWLPGRFDRRGRWIFDVAHNPAGTRTLVSTLEREAVGRPLHVVFGALRDKDGPAMASALAAVADRVWITVPPAAPVERIPDPSAWKADRGNVVVAPDFGMALDAASIGAGSVLVTGSFYTVGAALARLPGFTPFG